MVLLLVPGAVAVAPAWDYAISPSVSGNQVTIAGTLTMNSTAVADRDVTLRIIDSQSRNIVADQVTSSATGTYSFGPYTLANDAYTAYVGGPTAAGSQTFTVSGPSTTIAVTGVSLNQATTSIVKGATATLTATVNPTNATTKTVTWATSDATVATVNGGTVTAVAAGKATITVTTDDGAKTASCAVTVTEPINITKDSVTTITTTPVTLIVPQTATGAKIDVTPGGSLPLVEVQAATSLGTVEIAIPDGTVATGPAGWTGSIELPTVKASASATVSGAQSVNAVVEVGLGNQTITFSKAVRLVVPGMAGKSAGYVRNGTFTAITRTVSADNQSTADSEIPANAEGTISVGSDLVIWTKHFTEFVAYTPVSSGGGGSGGGGGSVLPSGTTVGTSGGTVTVGEASVVVPADAVSANTRITITDIGALSSLTLPTNGKLAGNVYEFVKDTSGNFNSPVTITLPYSKSKVDSAKDELAINYWDGSKWIALDNTKVDTATAKVSGTVNHFTKFAVIAIGKESTPVKQETPVKISPTVLLTDISGHWAEASINQLVSIGAIGGYPNGTYMPDKTITRAEFCVVLVKSFKLPVNNSMVYSDTAAHWAKDYISAAATAGIVSGYGNNSFGPDDFITREQMAVMVSKAAKLQATNQSLEFIDSNSISQWARSSVQAVAANRIISGYADNSFKPKAKATRAEVAAVIVKAISK